RKSTAKKLQKEIIESLKFLGIKDGNFVVDFQTTETDNGDNFVLVNDKKFRSFTNGIDRVEFFISTNLGEEVKPLIKVASGGEVSRIMLALKSSLAKNDKLPLLIFDEIDTGVSGQIASKVGKMMKDLAEYHQIIAITHLPQIAALSDHHYSVYKSQSNGRVISGIKKLNKEEKVREIAKLMSGEEITENALKSAKELIPS
ncbi:MAG: DNA repair protein RecN, partial [Ignavibacteria bacterium]